MFLGFEVVDVSALNGAEWVSGRWQNRPDFGVALEDLVQPLFEAGLQLRCRGCAWRSILLSNCADRSKVRSSGLASGTVGLLVKVIMLHATLLHTSRPLFQSKSQSGYRRSAQYQFVVEYLSLSIALHGLLPLEDISVVPDSL